MIDQAEHLRQLVRDRRRPADRAPNARAVADPSEARAATLAPSPSGTEQDEGSSPITSTPRPRVIAIASGKGGVGKSNIAVNLAARLSELGRRVVLVDLDIGLANADVLCGLTVPFNLSHVLGDGHHHQHRSLHEVAVRAPGGFCLIPGASGIAELADLRDSARQRLITQLSALERACDILLFDTAAGISLSVTSFAVIADTLLVVTTPEPTSIADAYGLIKAVLRRGGSTPAIALLVNQVAGEDEGRRVYDRIAHVARRFLRLELCYAGSIPRDDAVPKAVAARRPFVLLSPNSPASKAVTRLCHTLDREVGATPESSGVPPTAGYYTRLLAWFRANPARDR